MGNYFAINIKYNKFKKENIMNNLNFSNKKQIIYPFIMASILATTLGCAATHHVDSKGRVQQHESTGQYIDDAVITTKVKAAVLNEPSLKSSEVNVETYKGVVQLSGFVSDLNDISRASSVARNVNGVKSVKNDLRLKSRQ